MAAWNHKAYGTLADPIRQSDLGEIASSYSCPKRFAYKKHEQFGGVEIQRKRAWGAACVGTGTHETIRAYADPRGAGCARILRGELPSFQAVRAFVEGQVLRAAEGLPIEWKQSPDTAMNEAAHMVLGALRSIAERAAEVVFVEAPFLTEIEAGPGKPPYYLTGTADLVYRPKDAPHELALADWKTGAQRQSEIVLDHGYQLGIYAHALSAGAFFPGTDRERRLAQFPRDMHVVHLRDFVPYQKAGTKAPSHRDELTHYHVSPGTKVSYKAGEMRGPGWYRAHRTELDVQRLKVSIRNIVSTVRLGRFVEHLGDDCARCAFKHACLEEGYAVSGNAKKRLDVALDGVDFDGLGEDFAA